MVDGNQVSFPLHWASTESSWGVGFLKLIKYVVTESCTINSTYILNRIMFFRKILLILDQENSARILKMPIFDSLVLAEFNKYGKSNWFSSVRTLRTVIQGGKAKLAGWENCSSWAPKWFYDSKIKPDISQDNFWVRSSQRNITQPQSGLNRGQNSTLKKSLDLVK